MSTVFAVTFEYSSAAHDSQRAASPHIPANDGLWNHAQRSCAFDWAIWNSTVAAPSCCSRCSPNEKRASVAIARREFLRVDQNVHRPTVVRSHR